MSILVIWTRSPVRAAGPLSLRDVRPRLLVVAAVGVELQRLLRARQQRFHRGVLGGQPAGQFHAVFPGEFVSRRPRDAGAEGQDGDDGDSLAYFTPRGGSVSGETCRRIGTLQR